MLGASFHKGRTTRKKSFHFHFFLKRHSGALTQMGENLVEEKKEEKKEEGKVMGGAGEEKEGGGGDGKKEEAKNEVGGEGEKKEGEGGEEKKGDEKVEEQNPEIVLKVDMHCEGCARKVQRSLRGFPGVEEVHTDSKAHTVVVKGKKADPLKVCERVQKKSGKKAQLISPLPKPPEEKKEEEPPKQEEKKEEPLVVTVVLTVRMHCESCAQVVQRRIHKMKGVESVETDLKNDKVIVKGVVDPKKLVEYVYKQTGKQATIVPPPTPPPEVKQEETKQEEKGESEKKDDKEGKECGEEEKKSEVKKSEYWPPPRYYNEYAYPPQIFSDENPNACSIM